LAQRFDVNFQVATIVGNQPPSFFSATITDRHDPSERPFYLDMVRALDSRNPGITYRTLVTQRVNGRVVPLTIQLLSWRKQQLYQGYW
jgi:hypothetical protein